MEKFSGNFVKDSLLHRPFNSASDTQDSKDLVQCLEDHREENCKLFTIAKNYKVIQTVVMPNGIAQMLFRSFLSFSSFHSVCTAHSSPVFPIILVHWR